jgi:hypothetical protein
MLDDRLCRLFGCDLSNIQDQFLGTPEPVYFTTISEFSQQTSIYQQALASFRQL